MEILAHRGMWTLPEEKNTLNAIQKAFVNGLGIETDLRDYNGKLVISHDVANDTSPLAEEMFKMYRDLGLNVQLALNVKADGIQKMLGELLEHYQIKNYFLFDMSVPELVVNDARGLYYYTRNSDIESDCVMYQRASGVWVDYFYDDLWLNEQVLAKHINQKKKVCIVSPELHGKDYKQLWKLLKDTGLYENELVTLCSDRPMVAREYFYD